MAIALDQSDRKILAELQRDARLTNLELAARVAMSPSSCLRRVRLMEEAGLIRGYVLLLNPKVAGLPGNAFVHITLDGQSRAVLDAFEAAIIKVPEVLSCYLLAGVADYIVHIAFCDTDDLERIHADILTRLPHVARLQSTLSLRTVKQETALPIRG
jgi:Lrp/AsnC family transcriptional regulator, leucine-responsive regulatory protein